MPGAMTGVKIMDGGCNYEVGRVLNVIGTATTTGHSVGQVTVQHINNNIGDTIRVVGVTSAVNSEYNELYRITGVSTSREVTVESRLQISGFTTEGLGPTVTESYCQETGPRLNISSLTYDKTSGIGTVTTSDTHGLDADNVIFIGGDYRELLQQRLRCNSGSGS